MVKKIVLAGYYGFDNAGDELILLSLISGLRSMDGNIKITVLSASPEKTKSSHGVEAVNRWNPLSVAAAVKNTDLMVFGGGGLLQDITSARSILYYLGLIRLAGLFGKKVFLLGQGVGPIMRKINRIMAKSILSKVDLITVRDVESARILKDCGLDNSKAVVTADLAYALNPEEAIKKSSESFVVGVVLRERGDNGIESYIKKVCERLKEKYGARIVFIPFHRTGDRMISERVAGTAGDREVISWDELKDIFEVYKSIDVILGMRLHSLILACLSNKPFAAISPVSKNCGYDTKIINFIKSIGLNQEDNVLDGREMNPDDFAEKVRELFINREKFHSVIDARVKELISLSKLNMIYLEKALNN